MHIYNKEIPFYYSQLVIAVGEDFSKLLTEIGIDKYPNIDNGCHGYCIKDTDKDGNFNIVILLHDDVDFSILAHECLHATHYCLAEICHIADYNNDEPECYLHGYIVKEACQFLKQNNIEIKW